MFDFVPYPCLLCGRLAGREDQLCRKCHVLILRRAEGEIDQAKVCSHGMLPNVRVRSLFCWRPDMDPMISKLVTHLKRGRSPRTWEVLASAFAHHHALDFSRPCQDVLLVPIPSQAGERDHAHHWTEQLARQFKVPMKNLLRRTGGPPQKTKRRSERRQIHLEALETSVPAGIKTIVICDDIVTSGATSRAAIQALNTGYSFEIWAFAHRSRLAP